MTNPSSSYKEELLNELKDLGFSGSYLSACLQESNETFLQGLRNVAQAQQVGMSKLATEAKVNRENLYTMLSEEGNPRLESLTSVLKVLGLQLAVEPINPDEAIEPIPETQAVPANAFSARLPTPSSILDPATLSKGIDLMTTFSHGWKDALVGMGAAQQRLLDLLAVQGPKISDLLAVQGPKISDLLTKFPADLSKTFLEADSARTSMLEAMLRATEVPGTAQDQTGPTQGIHLVQTAKESGEINGWTTPMSIPPPQMQLLRKTA